ncbi:MAG: hypothetical protein U0R18_21200 [Mycobacterium sp.]
MPMFGRYYTEAETVAIAHERGHVDITRNSVQKAAYDGDRPLVRTKIGNKVYYLDDDIDNWLTGRIQRLDGSRVSSAERKREKALRQLAEAEAVLAELETVSN